MKEGKPPVEPVFVQHKHGKHSWYYLSGQRPDEVLLFKIFDSDEAAKTRCVAHTSVDLPELEHLPTRESIEMRCFGVY